jgi:predicted DNA-binding transcriptional regulator YafY
MAKQRSDADRRVRQCERFARLLRLTRLLLGHGRWGPEDLAKEIGCSPRTIYRDIQTLGMAGIPIHFDKGCQAYRVPDGFTFPGIEIAPTKPNLLAEDDAKLAQILLPIRQFITDAEQMLEQLKHVCVSLEVKKPRQ